MWNIEIVKDNDVATAEMRCQLGFDIGIDGVPSLAAQAASAQRGHVGVLTLGFVDEDKPCRLGARQGVALFTPFTPRRFDVGAFLLRCQQRFFYTETPPDTAA